MGNTGHPYNQVICSAFGFTCNLLLNTKESSNIKDQMLALHKNAQRKENQLRLSLLAVILSTVLVS